MREKLKRFQYYMPVFIREPAKAYLKKLLSHVYFIRCTINRFFFINNILQKKKFLHLGCGDVKIDSCLNLDARATSATDLVHDCSNLSLFREKTFATVYSHAFFEHIYRNQRTPLLNDIRRILQDNGFLLFLGLPDFERVAQAYLNKEKGLFSDKFDLFEVYRYTHGDPERYPSWWLHQLHKSLFDKEETAKLLLESGFKHFLIFRYCYRSEQLPVSLGFYATVSETGEISAKELHSIIDQFTDNVNKKTIIFLDQK